MNLAGAQDEVGLTAQNALLILSQNKTKVDELTQSFGNAAKNSKVLGETIGTMTDNLTTDLDKLSVAWDNVWLSIDKGDGVLSNVSRWFVQVGKDALDAISKMTNSAKGIAETSRPGIEKQVGADIKQMATRPGAKSGTLDYNYTDLSFMTDLFKKREEIIKTRMVAERNMIKADNSLWFSQARRISWRFNGRWSFRWFCGTLFRTIRL